MEPNTTQTAAAAAPSEGLSTTNIIMIVLALIAVGGFFLWPTISKALGGEAAPIVPPVGTSGTGGAALPGTGATGAHHSDYVSDELLNKVVMSNYEKYSPLIPDGVSYDKATPAQQYAYNTYRARVKELFGEDKGSDSMDYRGAYVDGFFKGMDLKQKMDYVGIFKDYIQQYLDSPTKLFHWDVKVGQFKK